MMEAVVDARDERASRPRLLSNSWGLDLYPRDRFPDMFDVVVISGEVGLRKPDPDIFTLTTESSVSRPSVASSSTTIPVT